MEHAQPMKGRPIEDAEYRFTEVSGSEGITAMQRCQEALVLFVGAERDAGATNEEILAFCESGGTERNTLNLKTRSGGAERREFEAAASTMRQLYGLDGWRILVRGYFQDALDAYDEAKKTLSSSEYEQDAAA